MAASTLHALALLSSISGLLLHHDQLEHTHIEEVESYCSAELGWVMNRIQQSHYACLCVGCFQACVWTKTSQYQTFNISYKYA